MYKHILPTFKGVSGYVLVTINTIFIFILFFPVALVKKIFHNDNIAKICLWYLHKMGKTWIIINYLIVKLLSGIKWEVTGSEKVNNLPQNKWYLLISNHQSWNDVFILQFLLNRKLPFQKYLVKEKMRSFPMMGFVWEALDCPFLKRSQLAEKQDFSAGIESGSDIENIKKKCVQFKLTPATITTFIEGTRYTVVKHDEQNSPYKYLLKPKIGGIAAILEELHNEIRGIIDVSICYLPRKLSFWDLFAGNINKISARIDFIELPDWLLEKYKNNIKYEQYKTEFNEWINTLWLCKDNYLQKKYNDLTI